MILSIEPETQNIEKGGISFILIDLKNIGGKDLEDISAEFSILNYTTNSEILKSLKWRENTILPIRINLPLDFPTGKYVGKIKIVSGEQEIKQDYEIQVFGSKEELINYRIERIEKNFEEINKRIELSKQAEIEVQDVILILEKVSANILLSKEYVSLKKYLLALNLLDKIEDDLENANYLLDMRNILESSFQTNFKKIMWIFVIFIILSVAIILLIFLKKFNILKKRNLLKKTIKKLEHMRKNKRFKENIGTLNEQYEQGYISEKTYHELKAKLDNGK